MSYRLITEKWERASYLWGKGWADLHPKILMYDNVFWMFYQADRLHGAMYAEDDTMPGCQHRQLWMDEDGTVIHVHVTRSKQKHGEDTV